MRAQWRPHQLSAKEKKSLEEKYKGSAGLPIALSHMQRVVTAAVEPA